MNIPTEQSEAVGPNNQFGLDFTIFQDIVSVLRRRKLVIALVTIGVVLSSFAALYFLTEQYQSEARLLVVLGRENTEVPLTVDKGDVFTSGVQQEEVNSEVQLLKSAQLIGEAVDKVGLDRFSFELPEPVTFVQRVKHAVKSTIRGAKRELREFLILLDLKEDLTDRQKVIKLVEGSLVVDREGTSNVIYLSLRLPSRELAQDTLEALLSRYFERRVRLRQSAGVLEVFTATTQQYRDEMQRAQDRTASIRREWGLSAVEAQRTDLLRRVSDLQTQVDEQRTRLASRLRERAAIESTLRTIPPLLTTSETLEPNPALLAIKEALIEKRLEEINLTGRYKADFPLLDSVAESIKELNALLTTEDPRRVGDVISVPHPSRLNFEQSLRELEVQIAGLRTSIDHKAAQVSVLEAELLRLDQGGDLLRLAELDLSVAERKYLEIAQRLTQAQISEQFDAMRVSNVKELSPPTALAEPVSPKKLLIMGVSVLAGLMLGGGLALVLEWLDDTIYTPRDLQSAGVPYLGAFSVRK